MGNRTIPGINIQWPWSEMIISGEKTVETRGYDLPKKHLGQELALIETPGPRGKKGAGILKARILGIVVFEESYRFNNANHWKKEIHKHRVSKHDAQFGFVDGTERWGWVIKKVIRFKSPVSPPLKKGIVFASRCSIPIL